LIKLIEGYGFCKMGKRILNSSYLGVDKRSAKSGLYGLNKHYLERLNGNFLAAPQGGAATDPYFSNVKLLLHMDSNFSDSSSSLKTATENGTPTINTTTKKFGAGAGDFGSGDDLQYADSSDWDIGIGGDNFTIEFWLYLTATSGTRVFFGYGAGNFWGSFGHQYTTFIDSGTFYFQYYNGSGTPTTSSFSVTGNISTGVWQHVAYVYDSSSTNKFAIFVDGARKDVNSSGGFTAVSGTPAFRVADTGAGSYSLNGLLDDFRFTKGVARYDPDSTTLTVPTAAFPNS